MSTTADNQSTTVEASVATVAEMQAGSMKMARVGERRVVLARTETGFHALDNACPHQGYGLATGTLDGELLTCQWHNWKFDVSDGRCVIGEEDAACHAVRIEGDEVIVSITHEDLAGSGIVMAHVVKLAVAARREAVATGSNLPLAAAARFSAAPRKERFVARGANEAIEFIRSGRPPKH